jgi:glycosyltransferase involved in cell wall biosynthesis
MLIDICIPIYNDETTLEKNILKVFNFCISQNFSFNWKIVIVINGTTDQSISIAKKLSTLDEKITYINIVNSGRGGALKYSWLESRAEIVCFMDSDLATDLTSLPLLLNPIINQEADITIGNRYHQDSKVQRSFIRKTTSLVFNFLAKKILGHNYQDLQCGFKAVRKNVFTEISPNIKDNHWFFDTELIIWGSLLHYKIKEIPVHWSEPDNKSNPSKVKLLKDSLGFIKNIFSLKRKLNKPRTL